MDITVIDTNGWYDVLVGDVKAIITERIYRSRQEVIECWYEVGARISTDPNYQKYAIGNKRAQKKLAQDIGKSVTSLYYATQFYKKFPEFNALNSLPDGKNLSWHKIVKNYLPSPEKETVVLPDGKWRVIYADPPWQYNSGDQHSEEEQATVLGTHYPSMSIKELCNLKVSDMAQDNSVLFMWVTSPLLEECFDVINAWGFKYKASIVWNKEAHNVGHYVSVRHEFLLICTRGSCQPDINTLFPSIVSEKRTEHSVKPETFRKMIDTMYPEGKRIELFARTRSDGWEVWGNDIN